MASDSIENLSTEDRSFLPTAEFAAQSNAKVDLYAEADKNRLAFWEKQAQALTWEKKWDKTLEWESPYAKWFVGGKLNATVSALDRHIADGNGSRLGKLLSKSRRSIADLSADIQGHHRYRQGCLAIMKLRWIAVRHIFALGAQSSAHAPLTSSLVVCQHLIK